jgi:periplasmic protein TonB
VLITKEIESRFHLEYVYHTLNEGLRYMNFTRTLLLSTVGHIGLVFVLVNHSVSELKPLMTKPDLAHYVKVRLRLPALIAEVAPEPTPAEEISEKVLTKTLVPHRQRKLAKAKAAPIPKKQSTPIAKSVRSSRTLRHPAKHKTASVTLVTQITKVDKSAVAKPTQPIAPKATTPILKNSAQKLTRKQRRGIKRAYWTRLTRFFKSTGYSYPKRAILAGQEGKVYVVIEIDPSGLIIDASISKSSGFPILDASALQAVLATKRVPPLPSRINQKNRKFRIPIEYRLPS